MAVKENITHEDDNSTTAKPETIHKHITEQSPMKGFLAVLLACFLSG